MFGNRRKIFKPGETAMIDFHTHIVYEIDDGAYDIETSMSLINALANQGVTDIVLTPHFYFDTKHVNTFLEQRDSKILELREKLGDRDITLHAGSEARLSTHTNVEHFSGLAIENTRYILVELPYDKEIKPALLEKIDHIIDYTGLTPIIAHAERYTYCQQNPDILKYMIMQGCLLQLNLTSLFLKRYSSLAMRMLEKNYVHVIGSDCHNLTTRPPEYEPGMKKIISRLGRDYFDGLQRNMRRILENKSVQPQDVTPIRKTLFFYR